MKYYVFLFTIFLLLPGAAYATLEITEIMYDQEGGDTGYEWIEVQNTGDEDVDMSTWYFFEAESYHKLTPESTSVLAPGDFALIVQNIENIQSLFGSLTYFKSSFSLSNTGETIALADSEKTLFSSVSYLIEDGASGNGKSLQRSASVWKEADPSPGAVYTEGGSSETEAQGAGQSQGKNDPKPLPPSYRAYLKIPETIIAESLVTFDVAVEKIQDGEASLRFSGVYHLNLGDGRVVIFDEPTEIEHIFHYPGRYTIVLEYYPSQLWIDAGQDPKVRVMKHITVLEHDLEILEVHEDGSISLINHLTPAVDISSWKIFQGAYEFSFPRDSYLLREQTLRIHPSMLGFYLQKDTPVVFSNEKYVRIDHYPHPQEEVQVKEEVSTLPPLEELRIGPEVIVEPKEVIPFIDDELPEKKTPFSSSIFLIILSLILLPLALSRLMKTKNAS